MVNSVGSWIPGHTILLITSPGWKIDKKIWLSVTSNTMFDIDPIIPDTFWLRGYTQRMTKREHINPPFPVDGKFDSLHLISLLLMDFKYLILRISPILIRKHCLLLLN
jgi:hypothetical protein